MLRKIEAMMKRNVHQLPPTATVYQAACLMTERKCGSIVVTTNGALEGIFTSGDVVRRVTAARRDPGQTQLAEVMTKAPDAVRPSTLAIDALRRMQDGHHRHLPVLVGERVVGIISRRDFFGQERSIVEEQDHLGETLR